MIDFTDCKQIQFKAYNGANGKKIAVEYNGSEYMLKFPPSGETKPTNLSYTNSCLSSQTISDLTKILSNSASLVYSVAFAGLPVPYLSVVSTFLTLGKLFYTIFTTE